MLVAAISRPHIEVSFKIIKDIDKEELILGIIEKLE
jgi:hypothetical protein